MFLRHSRNHGGAGPLENRVLGHEAVGEVVEIEEEVTRFKPGKIFNKEYHGFDKIEDAFKEMDEKQETLLNQSST